MKRLHYFLTLACFVLCNAVYAQVGINTRTPDPSAALDITGVGKGVLIPRMTLAQRPNSPVSGLLIYQTDNQPGFYYFNGTRWQLLNGSGFNDTLTQNLYTNGFWLSGDGQNDGIYLQGNGTMIDSGTFNAGPNITVTGPGTRMLWYPKRSALRAGTAIGNEWDDNNIGNYSAAMGYGSNASGTYATAVGDRNTASGVASMASGSVNIASGNNSFVSGSNDTASGANTVAMGSYVSTNSHKGAFAFGDNSTTIVTNNDADNQMKMRFAGGYKLYTDGNATNGMEITSGGLLKYMNNMAGSYDARTVVDKNYVDSLLDDAYIWKQNVNTNGHFLSGDGTNTGVYMLPNGVMVDSGAFNTGADLAISGAGTRMIWYPKKAAFRSGAVDGPQWDNNNIGDYSSALGHNNTASGNSSMAAGTANTAAGANTLALGNGNVASGSNAIAMGQGSAASGDNSFAAGNNANADGKYTAAMGRNVSTNFKHGSFILGDSSATVTNNDTFNQMLMRFAGGYKLYTDPATGKGIQITPGGVINYFNNVSGSYDSLSLVDKNYVDSLVDDAYTWHKNVNTNGHFLSGDGTNTGVYMLTNGLMVDTGSFNAGISLAIAGEGTRMIWYPKKAAFRVGGVTSAHSNYWDDSNIGQYSMALGQDNKVNGYAGTALGQNNVVGGQQNFAAGYQNTATGASSIAIGVYCNTSGNGAAAIGYQNTASGGGSTALGQFTFSQGLRSFAAGYTAFASGDYSFAMGRNVSTNSKHGSFIMGDTASSTLNNDAYNQMMMRFKGGFKLYDNATVNQGLLMDDGSMIQTGTFGSGTDIAISGAGTRMIWYDKKGAFRAGGISGGQWDNANIANYSVAMGQNTMANGINSVATGGNSYASGTYAVAMGQNDSATGSNAVAMGSFNKATQSGAVAMGLSNTASGQNSFAVGQNDTAGAGAAAVLGSGNAAMGANSFVAGGGNRASANYASVLGKNSQASGFASTAMGEVDTSTANYAVALGWSNKSSGQKSFTVGGGNKASGTGAFAGGESCTATGNDAIAIGYNSTATNWGAVALGLTSLASGQNSFAVGQWDTASGNAAVALCSGNVSSGINSLTAGTANRATNYYTVAFGRSALASGYTATADGYSDTASGDYSVAFGTRVSTNSHAGSFIFGDARTVFNSTRNDADNQMMMRFVGGYKLYTDTLSAVGVQVAAGGNSWATISDVRKKENFVPVNGEDILHKISKFRLTSWNYKGQNPKQFRHYGPMAQDFYAAFGKDKLGTVGNDTTIGQADMEGISFTAIQALEKRTQQLQQDNDRATAEISTLKKENDELQARMAKMEKEFEDRMQQVETAIIKQKSKNKVAVK